MCVWVSVPERGRHASSSTLQPLMIASVQPDLSLLVALPVTGAFSILLAKEARWEAEIPSHVVCGAVVLACVNDFLKWRLGPSLRRKEQSRSQARAHRRREGGRKEGGRVENGEVLQRRHH